MSYWDDEDYFEPSEFDEKIEELKEELRNSVKQEIKDEVERLRKENEELRDIKDNFEVIKADFESKKFEYEMATKNAELKAKQARLTELMELYKLTLWSVKWHYQYKKKCDKCNFWRNIEVTLPSGNVVDDACKCKVSKKVYHPKENVLYEMNDIDREINVFYKKKGDKGREYFVADVNEEYAKVIVDHNKDFKRIEEEGFIRTFFTTKEECQEFCDYLNGTEKNSGYDYDLEGQLIR